MLKGVNHAAGSRGRSLAVLGELHQAGKVGGEEAAVITEGKATHWQPLCAIKRQDDIPAEEEGGVNDPSNCLIAVRREGASLGVPLP